MKLLQNLIQFHVVVFIFVCATDLYADINLGSSDLLHFSCGAQVAQEIFVAENLSLLNDAYPQDSVSYLRSTIDYFLHCKYGNLDNPRIDMYSVMRFRYIWGSQTGTEIADSNFLISDSTLTVPGRATNKHLLWMRESWVKVMIGADASKKNFVQIGLIPYQVGRGISLGSAYDTSGFLGFTVGYDIDQYAPAVLLSFELTKKSNLDWYFALIENSQTSLSEIFEKIRTSELKTCPIRGVARQSYIVALRNKTVFENEKKHTLTVEPYIVHQHAPDKHFEFQYDIDTTLSSCGFALEAELGRLSWGFETAGNLGDAYIKPWDRNSVTIIKKDDGSLVEQYTKIYDQSPSNSAATLVDATATNAVYVDASSGDVNTNGRQIGPDLFNAFDRFRPAQNIKLHGYFFVADVAYEQVPKVLKWGLGTGYVSGGVHYQQDLNKLSPFRCLNQSFAGFIPLQSEYSGTRIRHFVMLNQGVPRFTVATEDAGNGTKNLNLSLALDTLNTMTNIAFIGTRLAFTPTALEKNSVLLAPNLIFYWAPEISHVIASTPTTVVSPVQPTNNFLGTELNLEFSAQIVQNLKIEGYAGILIPGGYYKDICGSIVKAYNKPIGHSVAYVANIGLLYSF